METRSFLVLAANYHLVDEQITKLNKRAAKLGLDQITLTWGKLMLNSKNESIFPCELSGPLSVKYDGWEFIATLQHLPTGENIIRAITNEYDIPLEYRTVGSNCEHCNVNRYRRDTYVIRHESGEARQVGSTCVKDFLGGNSPDNILQRASFVGDLISFMRNAGSVAQGSDEGIFHITSVLTKAAACIRCFGWVSKAQAKEADVESTAAKVEALLRGDEINHLSISEEDSQIAISAAEWAENISDDECESSDYLHNIRAIARSAMVGWRTIGFAASIIFAYNRANTKPAKESNYFGTVKKREIFELTATNVSGFDSMYGYTNKYIFEDKNGNVAVWITSSSKDIEKGKTYSIKGTVKEHSVFRDVKQTVLSRCEVVSNG